MKKQYYLSLYTLAMLCLLMAGCHSQQPLGLNEQASVQPADELPENPLLLHALTSSLQPKDSIMCILYGNDAAFAYAAKHSDGRYPVGAVLYNVAWKQQPDEQWAGGNIPAAITTVERVAIDAAGMPVYTLYTGSPLKKVAVNGADSLRLSAILRLRMAASPR
ncbi:hypothetical protein SAMN05421788_102455 [Filimonas lacunae]|uniref:Cytochrome P460 n=1 Tax=Filimonas lacunae TaxID=477680 RepID=A0A173MH18_9BACT|nr:hypothetical protein [Filimonas lacunae]BAV06912.1 hypothetical protein FLA_2932 [Filimonas lacunae]SIS97953.1 hypothetical protein SAMN05421788_102455 [Filimonas lacunae]